MGIQNCNSGELNMTFTPAKKVVVAFYASPAFPTERNSPTDKRPAMLEFIEKLKIPMQFHYGMRDDLIPNENAEKLREKLLSKNRKTEIYIYNEAQHGFANIIDETYRADDAALAEKRWRKFLRKHL